MGGVTDVGGELLDQGGENGVGISRDKFDGTGAGGDNVLTRAVGFVDFGKEIETSDAGLGNDEVGGCGWEVTCSDEVVDGLGDDGLVLGGGVMIKW
eukprot:g13381.t1